MDTFENHKTEAAVIEALASKQVQTVKAGHTEVLVYPRDLAVEDTEKYREEPSRGKGVKTLHTLESLIAYVLRRQATYGQDHAEVYADEPGDNIKVVLNAAKNDGTTGWGDYGAAYSLPLSEEWKAWNDGDGTAMTQVKFARFIEENVDDIVIPKNPDGEVTDPDAPSGADMLEIAKNFEAKKAVSFSGGVRLDSGSYEISYSDDTRATGGRGTLVVPAYFYIGIPVYKHGQPYKLLARFRYRVSEDGLKVWYELKKPEKTHEHAFDQVCADLTEKLKPIPVYRAATR